MPYYRPAPRPRFPVARIPRSPARGLGIISPTTVQSGYQLYQSLQSVYEISKKLWDAHPLDRDRLEKNYKAFEAAAQGDNHALEFLKQRTGNFAPVQMDERLPYLPYTGLVGGWATQTAKNDAIQKYGDAQRVRNGEPLALGGRLNLSASPLVIAGGVLLGVMVVRSIARRR